MADPAFGAKSVVTLDFESSWGTAKGSPAAKKIAVLTNGITGTQELIENPTMRGDFNSSDAINGKKAASGALTMIPNVDVLPFFVKLLTGGLTTTGAADPYSHVGKITNVTPLSAVLETSWDIGGTARYSLASGLRISKWSIPFAADNFLQMSVDMMGKDVVVGTTSYGAAGVDWSTGSPLEHLQLASADVKVGGSAVAYVVSGQIDLDTGLYGDDYRVGGGGARGSLVPGRHKVSGNLKLALDSTSVMTLITGGAASSLELTWTAGTNRTFNVKVPRIVIQKTQPILQGDGPIFCDCQFRGSYDGTALSSIVYTIGNGTAGTVYV